MRTVISTKDAPEAIGPYSQGIKTGGFVFTAGQIPLAPATGKIVEGGIKEQTRQVLENLRSVVEAGGGSLPMVVKTTVYLTRPDDFAAMNEVYGEYFTGKAPARTTVFVSALPKGALVEIDAVAATS